MARVGGGEGREGFMGHGRPEIFSHEEGGSHGGV